MTLKPISIRISLLLMLVGCAAPVTDPPPTHTPPTPIITIAPPQPAIPTPAPLPSTAPPPLIPTIDNQLSGPIPDGALARLGKGAVQYMELIDEGQTLVIGTPTGVYAYNVQTLDEVWRIPVDHMKDMDITDDGKQLAVLKLDNDIFLWDVSTRSVLHQLSSPINITDNINQISFSPDGTRLASANAYFPAVYVWDTQSGLILNEFSLDFTISDEVEFLADNQILILSTMYSQQVYLLDSVNGQSLSLNHGLNNFTLITLSPDRTHLAISTVFGIEIWDMTTRRQLTIIQSENYTLNMTFTPDNAYLITLGDETDLASVWEVNSGREISQFHVQTYANDFLFLPDNQTVVLPLPDGIVLYDIKSETITGRLDAHWTTELNDIIVSPGSSSIFFTAGNVVKRWDLQTGQVSIMIEQPDLITHLTMSENGQRIAMIVDINVVIWDFGVNQEIMRSEIGEPYSGEYMLDISPDGSQVLIGTVGRESSYLELVYPDSLQRIRVDRRTQVLDAAFTSEGKPVGLVWRDDNHGLYLFDAISGDHIVDYQLDVSSDHPNAVFMMLDHGLVGLVVDASNYLLDIETGQTRLVGGQGHNYRHIRMSISPDGRLLATCFDKDGLSLRETIGTSESSFLIKLMDECWSVVFSSDGSYLFATSVQDGTITVWPVPQPDGD